MQHDQPIGAVSSTASNKYVRARANDSTSTSDIPITIKVLLTHALVYLSVVRKHYSGLAYLAVRTSTLLHCLTSCFFSQVHVSLLNPRAPTPVKVGCKRPLFSAAPPTSSICLGHILAMEIRDHRLTVSNYSRGKKFTYATCEPVRSAMHLRW